jgi:hypothetical protein
LLTAYDCSADFLRTDPRSTPLKHQWPAEEIEAPDGPGDPTQLAKGSKISMSNHPITPLASAEVNHDHLKVELVEPDSMPAVVRITWPAAPTIVDPKRFPDVAAAIAQLFARAHTVLASIKAGRLL